MFIQVINFSLSLLILTRLYDFIFPHQHPTDRNDQPTDTIDDKRQSFVCANKNKLVATTVSVYVGRSFFCLINRSRL